MSHRLTNEHGRTLIAGRSPLAQCAHSAKHPSPPWVVAAGSAGGTQPREYQNQKGKGSGCGVTAAHSHWSSSARDHVSFTAFVTLGKGKACLLTVSVTLGSCRFIKSIFCS